MSASDIATDVTSSLKPRDDEADFWGLTHAGRVRKENQDHFLLCSLHKQVEIHKTSLPDVSQLPLGRERMAFLAMVADGVGGGPSGETASRLALEAVTEYLTLSMECYQALDTHDDEAFLQGLQEAAWACHGKVLAEAETNPMRRRMATTLTLWLGVWPRAYLLQVGDSRYYIFRNDRLTRISRDQTVAQDLTDQGVLTPATAAGSQWENYLSSAIGGHHTAPVVTCLNQDWDNIGLLCSDGLTKHVSDEQIAGRLRNMTSPKQACEALLQDALDAGGTDNITIIVGQDVKRERGDP